MKNFPHQYNDLTKLRATLEAVEALNNRGADVEDDGILGTELARRRVYDFRPRIAEGGGADAIRQRIEDRLVAEHRKPAQNQGTRTAAREMRRTLRHLGWLSHATTDLTAQGDALLASDPGSAEESALVQEALLRIAVEGGDGRLSHPMKILLLLVDENVLSSRKPMALALEAADDSPEELARIMALAALDEDAQREQLLNLGWTDHQLANAVKILPSFALQAGLLTTDAAGSFALTEAGRRALGRPVDDGAGTAPAPPRRRPARRRHAGTITTRDPNEVGKPRRLLTEGRRAQTAEEQEMAAALLYERTERHQLLVRSFAEACRPAEFAEDRFSFDLVVDQDPNLDLALAEMKSIERDEAAQIQRGVGQLFYYEHFAVADAFPGRGVRRVIVVDAPIGDELAEFLQQLGIGLVVQVDGDFIGYNAMGIAIVNDFIE